MKNIFEKLDQKYLKICLYASITALVSVGIGALLLSSGPFWVKLFSIFGAVLRPIIIGGVICYLFLPIVNKFEKMFNKKKEHKWARAVSVFLTYAIILLAVGAIIILIFITIYKNADALTFENLKMLFDSIRNDYADIWNYITVKVESMDFLSDSMTTTISTITSSVSSFFSGMLFGVIFSIYFMLDGNRIGKYWTRALHIIFGDGFKEKLNVLAKDADNAFSGYIRGQFLDALIIGIISTVALTAVGVPSSAIIGIFVGVGNMIPYIGPVVGYITLAVVCIPIGALEKFLIGAVVLAIAMFIDGNVINPKLLSNAVDVHTLLVVAALIAGGAVGGIAGMLIAVPTAALVKLQFDRYLEKKEHSKNE